MTLEQERRRTRVTAALRGGPLAIRGFQLLAGGQFASTIGDYCYAVALPWLVLSNRGSPALLGTVLACYGVPRMVLIPVGGVLADKFGPRLLMMSADVLRCLLVLVLAVLAAKHTASLAALGPTAALIGAGEGLFLPSSMAIMPALVAGAQLPAANAISSAMVQGGSLIGPAVGGVLVATTGSSTAAFAVDAASFAISALTLAFVRPGPAVQAEEVTQEDTCGVIKYLRQSRAMRVIMLVVIAANLASGATSEVALPSLAHASWGAGGYGAVLACFAAGAVLGTLGAARTGGLARPTVFAGAVFVLEAAAICLVPYLGGEAGAAAAMFVSGATNGLGNITFLTVAQQQIPPAIMGRVMSAVMLGAFGTFPLSVAVAGLLVKHIGAAPLFPIAGALVGISMLAGLTSREFRGFGSQAPGSLCSTRFAEIGGPLRIAVVVGADQPPVRAARHHRRDGKRPAKFLKQPVRLAVVAAGAGGHAVLPGMGTAAAARDHVVDRLRLVPAVGAPVVVPAHQRGPGQRHPVAVRDAHVAAEPDHGGCYQCYRGGVQHCSADVIVDDFRLTTEHEAHRAPQTDRGQRLIRNVEQQHSSHCTSRSRRGDLTELHTSSVSPGTLLRHQISVQGASECPAMTRPPSRGRPLR
jgi:MFS family permease